jgi:hypothetical protein
MQTATARISASSCPSASSMPYVHPEDFLARGRLENECLSDAERLAVHLERRLVGFGLDPVVVSDREHLLAHLVFHASPPTAEPTLLEELMASAIACTKFSGASKGAAWPAPSMRYVVAVGIAAASNLTKRAMPFALLAP